MSSFAPGGCATNSTVMHSPGAKARPMSAPRQGRSMTRSANNTMRTSLSRPASPAPSSPRGQHVYNHQQQQQVGELGSEYQMHDRAWTPPGIAALFVSPNKTTLRVNSYPRSPSPTHRRSVSPRSVQPGSPGSGYPAVDPFLVKALQTTASSNDSFTISTRVFDGPESGFRRERRIAAQMKGAPRLRARIQPVSHTTSTYRSGTTNLSHSEYDVMQQKYDLGGAGADHEDHASDWDAEDERSIRSAAQELDMYLTRQHGIPSDDAAAAARVGNRESARAKTLTSHMAALKLRLH